MNKKLFGFIFFVIILGGAIFSYTIFSGGEEPASEDMEAEETTNTVVEEEKKEEVDPLLVESRKIIENFFYNIYLVDNVEAYNTLMEDTWANSEPYKEAFKVMYDIKSETDAKLTISNESIEKNESEDSVIYTANLHTIVTHNNG